ncbi:hypothetical protein [Vitiosangium sp. GDMCC 1.1324]|uniref:hypothetical protein n=1 Tax=Vitiosangium sp. (strain GDMCC 1.1324) TaxID=2138576 RepID=UPI0011B489A7|nr:hypothetical protein [Vitiosangium sp. GDMCC 1.1324]
MRGRTTFRHCGGWRMTSSGPGGGRRGRRSPEVRRAVLERLGDSDRRVRRFALQLLGQLQEVDAEVCRALEEQVILDDDNRMPALRLLARIDPG